MLWSDIPERQAKTNLRYVLYDLRKIIGECLVTSRQVVSLKPNSISWVDANVFALFFATEASTAEPQVVQEVLKLYRGELLAGFHIQNAPSFDIWLETQRRSFHNQAVQALHNLCQKVLESGDYALGLTAARQLLHLEPGCEKAHRYIMRFLAYTGRRTAAIAQYALCQEDLQNEIDVEPDIETVELFTQIQSGQLTMPSSPSATLPPQTPQSSNQICQVNWEDIPARDHFIGRSEELVKLQHWINQEQYQLIGLFGLAGQGKSTLTAEIVARLSMSAVDTPLPDSDKDRLFDPSPHFEQIVWSSVSSFSSLLELLQSWCQQLMNGHYFTDDDTQAKVKVDTIPMSLDACWQILLPHLRSRRTLLVLDDFDRIFANRNDGYDTSSQLRTKQEGGHQPVGSYQTAWKECDEVLQRLARTQHRSCVILQSQIVPASWRNISQQYSSVRHFILSGFQKAESISYIQSISRESRSALLDAIAIATTGNPQLLTTLIEFARDFDDQLFIETISNESLNELIYELLAPIFQLLTELEKDILLRLHSMSNGTSTSISTNVISQYETTTNAAGTTHTLQGFWKMFDGGISYLAYLQAVDSLRRHHFLELYGPDKTFRTPKLVKQFLEHFLLMSISQEIFLLVRSHRQSYVKVLDHENEEYRTSMPFGIHKSKLKLAYE
ncbi:MAG: bacterial transcriptional activator domain-containing protein [Chloroflexota bacterium]